MEFVLGLLDRSHPQQRTRVIDGTNLELKRPREQRQVGGSRNATSIILLTSDPSGSDWNPDHSGNWTCILVPHHSAAEETASTPTEPPSAGPNMAPSLLTSGPFDWKFECRVLCCVSLTRPFSLFSCINFLGKKGDQKKGCCRQRVPPSCLQVQKAKGKRWH